MRPTSRGSQPSIFLVHSLEAGPLPATHIADRGGISDLVKVVDFGLVKDVGALAAGGATSEPALTMADQITGTPLYMAPETLVAPETIDARADLYALGAVGYWLLTGTHVFGGNSIFEGRGARAQTPLSRPAAPTSRSRVSPTPTEATRIWRAFGAGPRSV